MPIGDTPMKIAFSVGEDQPYTEEQSYFLRIIFKREDLFGNLDKLHNLYLYVPSNVEVNDDARLCEFEQVEENVYRLRDSALAYYNKDCSKDSLIGTAMSVEDCISTYKDEIAAICEIRFQVDEETSVPSFVDFKAKAEYSYDIKKHFAIDVIPSEGAFVACQGTSKEQCTDKGCMFVEGEGCKVCPDKWKGCSDYENQDICNWDPCNFGGCILEGTACKVKT